MGFVVIHVTDWLIAGVVGFAVVCLIIAAIEWHLNRSMTLGLRRTVDDKPDDL